MVVLYILAFVLYYICDYREYVERRPFIVLLYVPHAVRLRSIRKRSWAEYVNKRRGNIWIEAWVNFWRGSFSHILNVRRCHDWEMEWMDWMPYLFPFGLSREKRLYICREKRPMILAAYPWHHPYPLTKYRTQPIFTQLLIIFVNGTPL